MAEAGEMVLWKTPGVIVSASFANLISLLTFLTAANCQNLQPLLMCALAFACV